MAAPTSLTTADKSKSFVPLANLTGDGWSTEDEATATCFCGAVQIVVVSLTFLFIPSNILSDSNLQPTKAPGLINTFVCNCYDCHKITASMFASNFTVADENIKWVRGRENLKTFAQKKTIASHGTMTNYFCSTCGSLSKYLWTASFFLFISLEIIGTFETSYLFQFLFR